jgi:hypothetical protein
MSWRLFLVLPTAFLFCACVNPSQNSSQAKVAQTAQVNNSPAALASIHFFRGGYYPAPGSPNWSHDLEIAVSGNSAGAVRGEDYDSSCFRVGLLNSQELNQLLAGIQTLQIKRATQDSGIVDIGVEYIELIYNSGQTRKIHLMPYEYRAGEELAANGSALAERLRSIGDNLNVGCY